MDYSTYEATGSTAGAASDFKNRGRIADTSSRITFAANEDLGGGTRAGVYCETGINIDTANANGQADTANANTSEWCSREGRAYYGSGAYELRLGRQNVWWTQGELNQVGSTFLGSDSMTNLINGGAGVFGVRLENMLKLAVTSGQFNGSEAYYGLMTANEKTAKATDPVGKYQGFKLLYTAGQLVGMVDYQASSDSAKTTAAAAIRSVCPMTSTTPPSCTGCPAGLRRRSELSGPWSGTHSTSCPPPRQPHSSLPCRSSSKLLCCGRRHCMGGQ